QRDVEHEAALPLVAHAGEPVAHRLLDVEPVLPAPIRHVRLGRVREIGVPPEVEVVEEVQVAAWVHPSGFRRQSAAAAFSARVPMRAGARRSGRGGRRRSAARSAARATAGWRFPSARAYVGSMARISGTWNGRYRYGREYGLGMPRS